MAGKRKKRARPGRTSFTLTIVMLTAAILLLLSYLSSFVNPASFWFLTIFGLLFVPVAILNLVLFVWAAVRRSRLFLLPLLALFPGIFLLGRYVRLPSDRPELEADMKIVSYNLGRLRCYFEGGERVAPDRTMDSVLSYIRKQDADIVCLQEFSCPLNVNINRYLTRRLPGYNCEYMVYPGTADQHGNVILSKYPVKDKASLDFEKSANLALWCDLETGQGTVRVYNCHLQSYNLTTAAVIKALARRSRSGIIDTEARMKTSIGLRFRQVAQVLADIEACPSKSVVAGDFNDGPLSYTYNVFSRGRRDSFEAGSGFGTTYSGIPGLRIDFILVPDDYIPVKHMAGKVKYSDHYPVVAHLKTTSDEN